MDRKNFLRNTAATVSALFAANWGSRAAIKAFKDPQKPLLTEKTLSFVLSKDGSRDRYPTKLNLAITDPKAFLEENFSLSPVQQKVIANFTGQDWDEIKGVLQTAKAQSAQLEFKFTLTGGKTGCDKFAAKALAPRGKLLKEIAVVPRM